MFLKTKEYLFFFFFFVICKLLLVVVDDRAEFYSINYLFILKKKFLMKLSIVCLAISNAKFL